MAIDTRQAIVEYVDPKILHSHPRNIAIYGNESVENLKQKIATSKWIKALVVTPANVIISGHSRWRVAIELGIAKIPVERRTFANEIEEIEALLLENVSRVKTPEQMVHEGETWEYLEKAKAKEVQKSQDTQGLLGKEHGKEGGRGNKKNPLVELVPQGGLAGDKKQKERKKPAPKTRDKVAAQVGFSSGTTYERAKKAVDAAKKLEQEFT